ncbi:hypothetical protein SESI111939_10100 [Serratia silvae]
MPRFVIVTMLEDGDEEFVHIRNGIEGSDYVTLCGLDGGVSGSEQSSRPASKNAKVTCRQCWGIWLACRGLKTTDFKAE